MRYGIINQTRYKRDSDSVIGAIDKLFGSHLAFTMAFDDRYVLPMIVGKFTAGICAVSLALLLYKEKEGTKE